MTDTLNSRAPMPINDTAKQGTPEINVAADARKRLGAAYDASTEMIGAAYETAIEVIRERPVAAAAVGIGMAATVAGATYGASRLKNARTTKSKP